MSVESCAPGAAGRGRPGSRYRRDSSDDTRAAHRILPRALRSWRCW